jgi:hypothetical protein
MLTIKEEAVTGPPTEEETVIGPPTEGETVFGPPTQGETVFGPPTEEETVVGPPTGDTACKPVDRGKKGRGVRAGQTDAAFGPVKREWTELEPIHGAAPATYGHCGRDRLMEVSAPVTARRVPHRRGAERESLGQRWKPSESVSPRSNWTGIMG